MVAVKLGKYVRRQARLTSTFSDLFDGGEPDIGHLLFTNFKKSRDIPICLPLYEEKLKDLDAQKLTLAAQVIQQGTRQRATASLSRARRSCPRATLEARWFPIGPGLQKHLRRLLQRVRPTLRR